MIAIGLQFNTWRAVYSLGAAEIDHFLFCNMLNCYPVYRCLSISLASNSSPCRGSGTVIFTCANTSLFEFFLSIDTPHILLKRNSSRKQSLGTHLVRLIEVI